MSLPLSSIEDRRKMLAWLKTLAHPSDAVLAMIREFSAEIAAHDGPHGPVKVARPKC